MNESQGYYSTLRAFDETLNQLRLDYLDIYLIHWPIPRGKEKIYKELNIETWMAMEKLKEMGKIKMIGVCNFLQRHLENLIQNCNIIPQLNQIEIHPRYQQRELVKYCKDYNMIVEAWGPFRNGKIFDEKKLEKIAKKHNVTIAQICLKWIVDNEIIPLPKSSVRERMKENLEFGNVILDEQDRKCILGMNEKNGHEDYWNYRRQLLY